MAEQNATVPQLKRIEFRIGIHVGDVIVDENDIFGDGPGSVAVGPYRAAQLPIRTLFRAILFVPWASLFDPLIPICMFILINHRD